MIVITPRGVSSVMLQFATEAVLQLAPRDGATREL